MFLAFMLLLIGGYYLFRQTGGNKFNQKASDAEEILKQRYVSGEIDEDTYHRILQTIRK